MTIKMTIIRPFIYAAIICVLPACQTAPKKTVNLRTGMPVAELIAAYGTPTSVTAERELNFYQWDLSGARLDSSKQRSGSGTFSNSGNFNPQIIRIYCRLNVTTNVQQQVQDWQANGEGCRQILLDKI